MGNHDSAKCSLEMEILGLALFNHIVLCWLVRCINEFPREGAQQALSIHKDDCHTIEILELKTGVNNISLCEKKNQTTYIHIYIYSYIHIYIHTYIHNTAYPDRGSFYVIDF